MPAARREIGVAVDLAVFTVERSLQVLLIQMKRAPFVGRWALPGGRIRGDETVEQAATRELAEKSGLANVFLEQLYTFSAPDRDPAGRCVSVAHWALIPKATVLRTTDKYSAIGWFSADRPPPLAFDHRAILAAAVRRLRERLASAHLAFGLGSRRGAAPLGGRAEGSLLPRAFTLPELQAVYEGILGRALDPRNFRKRVVGLGLVEETGEMRTGAPHRPSRLFRFTRRAPARR